MMKRVMMLGLIALIFMNCGGSGSEIVPPNEDKVAAVNDSYHTIENTAVVLPNFLANDTFSTGNVKVTFEATTSKSGKVEQSGNQYTYTPAKDFVGTDSFKYTICSTLTTSNCSTATVLITVKSSPAPNTGSFNLPADLVDYYKSVNLSLTGNSLKDALAAKVISSHTKNLIYTPEVWEVLKESDLDPTNSNKVLLMYGFNDNDSNTTNDRTRDKNQNGGNAGDWNREHVYPKSLAIPNLGTTGPGSDAHNLRACDGALNSQRSNKKFITGSGDAGTVSGNWFPGEEWKGDVARMMMYMYLRYGSQCLPKNVTIGTANSSDSNMIDLLLEWNIQDPVSDFEKKRNNVIAKAQGNRNPLIDNPYLATVIWGGGEAENTWK